MDVTSHDRPSVPDAPQILAPENPEQAQALEAERISRQDRLPGFDQQAVANAHVLVIGAGGLGCPVVQALAAAGGGPGLAALVVSAATGEVGTGDSSWAPPQRLACWARWGEKRAND